MDLGRIDYQTTTVPDAYRCTTCGAHGCKLWREYSSFASQQTLACCDCAGEEAKRTSKCGYDVALIDEHGLLPLRYSDGVDAGFTDQIGWRTPAVPTENGGNFWGYTSVPTPGVDWWRRLPTRVSKQG